MRQSSKIKHSKDHSNTLLRILNYRNAKFQGLVHKSKQTPQGIGMILDQNYLLAVANWTNGIINGPAVVIYPDCSIFYGNIRQKSPQGFCCRQVSSHEIIYFYGEEGKERLFIYEAHAANTLHLCTGILGANSENRDRGLKGIDQIKQIQIKQSITYNTQEEKWSSIQNYFKKQLPKEVRDYKSFLKYHFITQIQPQTLKLVVTQTKDIFDFGFKKSSIGCKIWDTIQASNTYQVACIGYYNEQLQDMEIYRKYHHNARKIQEYLDGEVFQYHINKPRSIQCGKELVKYFMSSLSYCNKCIGLGYLEKIRTLFNRVSRYVSEEKLVNQAQLLLKGTQNRQFDSPSKEQEKTNIKTMKEYYEKRHNMRSHDRNKSVEKIAQLSRKVQGKQPEKEQHRRSTDIYKNSISQDLYSNVRYEPIVIHERSSYSRINGESPGGNRHKKSYKYLYDDESPQQQERKHTQQSIERTPSKYNYLNEKVQRKAISPVNPFSATQNNRSPPVNESISVLMKDYELIQNNLQRENSKRNLRKDRVSPNQTMMSRSPSRTFLDKSRQRSPSNGSWAHRYYWR